MKAFLKSAAIFLFQLTLMLVLPFWVLIRGSIFLYAAYGWHYLPALLLTGLIVACILLVYITMIWDWVMGAETINRRSIRFKSFLVAFFLLFYTGYTLYNLSGANAKSEEVRKEYRSLHPYLRLAVGTFVWLDGDLLVTDLSRSAEDYGRMGLKRKGQSLHYPQSTGFVHAMDLRTQGRSGFRNFLLKTYFQLMGFNTLRHGGTGDHLHVSLSVRGQGGI